jgi:hypothetical protein
MTEASSEPAILVDTSNVRKGPKSDMHTAIFSLDAHVFCCYFVLMLDRRSISPISFAVASAQSTALTCLPRIFADFALLLARCSYALRERAFSCDVSVTFRGSAAIHQMLKSAFTKSAARSPIIIEGALVLPDTSRGMMLASAT